MKLTYIFSAILICISALTANAQSHSNGARRAHQKAHQEQLANVRNRLDRSTLKDLVKNDIEEREHKNEYDAKTSGIVADLLTEANRHIGKRYVHGAKGPSQFDCSGFSSYVYKQLGYSISTSSRAQFNEGVSVKRNDLRKGDLVFFTSRSSGKNVGHVGIVVSADNEKGTFKFIHASIKGVKISNFEGYYVPRYLGARRIIND